MIKLQKAVTKITHTSKYRSYQVPNSPGRTRIFNPTSRQTHADKVSTKHVATPAGGNSTRISSLIPSPTQCTLRVMNGSCVGERLVSIRAYQLPQGGSTTRTLSTDTSCMGITKKWSWRMASVPSPQHFPKLAL